MRSHNSFFYLRFTIYDLLFQELSTFYHLLNYQYDSSRNLSLQRKTTSADIVAGEQVCPVCSREARDEFIPLDAMTEDLQKLIRANASDTRKFEAVCARCARLFERRKRRF
jgi:hypothetical protein